MKKLGIILLAVLLIFSLLGCSSQDSGKVQTEQYRNITKKTPIPKIKQPEAHLSPDKNAAEQNTTSKSSDPGENRNSSELTELNSTLESLNEVVNGLEDVTNEELTIPSV